MASFFLYFDKSVGKETGYVLNDSPEKYDDVSSWEFKDDKSGCCIVSDSRIDYRRELAGKLDIKWNVAETFSDSKFILFAYLKWQEACLSHLYGDFSFVIWDPLKDEIFFARDQLGCRPLYYVDQAEFLAVASKISAFKSLPGFEFEIREQYILDSICSIQKSDKQTAYKGISRLKPAHYLKQSSGQSSSQHRYWDLKTNEAFGALTFEEAVDELRDRCIDAVRQRSLTTGQIGVELSGGLDSSGIAAILAKLYGQKNTIHAFTHSISSEGAAQTKYLENEMEYSTALVEKYSSIRHFEITEENSEGGYKALKEAIYSLYKPINLHYALNSDLLFEAAGNLGASIMFSGFGGDEGISNNGEGYFNELIRHGQHSKLRDTIKHIASRRGGAVYKRLIKLYINYYAPWVLNLYKRDWRKARYRSFAPSEFLARKYRMKQRFFQSTPIQEKPDVRSIQYFRLMYPNIPERIEETSLLARQHDIDYRYPLLDVKLLEFFYSLPSEYKYKEGTGRYLFRMAMKDILPEKIRTRTNKGGNTIPNVFARVLKDENIFREIIEEGRLKNQYHYVDYDKLHEMLDSFKQIGDLERKDYGLKSFQSPMSILILQKWQREGRIDIGIKF